MTELSDSRDAPMFEDRSLGKSDMATDFAIPVLAEGGWSAVTMAAVAAQGRIKRQSVAQWFGNAEEMRQRIAWCYTRRWVRLLSGQVARPGNSDAATIARLLLPRDDDGIVFARIWLSICDAGRSDLGVAAATAFGEDEQLAMTEHALPDTQPHELRALSALVTGLRTQLCAFDPISLADAHAATRALRGETSALRR